jgi:carbon storage regulator
LKTGWFEWRSFRRILEFFAPHSSGVHAALSSFAADTLICSHHTLTATEVNMLVLSRKLGESVQVGDGIVIRIVEVRRSRVRIGIEAPASVRIQRQEIAGRPDNRAFEAELLLGSTAGAY